MKWTAPDFSPDVYITLVFICLFMSIFLSSSSIFSYNLTYSLVPVLHYYQGSLSPSVCIAYLKTVPLTTDNTMNIILETNRHN